MDRRTPGRARRRGASAIGYLPTRESLDVSGLDLDERCLQRLLRVDHDVWAHEAALIKDHLATFIPHLPEQLWNEHKALLNRLADTDSPD